MTAIIFGRNNLMDEEGDAMNARKGLIFSLSVILLALLILNKPSKDPVREAWIERDEEEASYINAIRWVHVKEHC